MEHSNAIRIWQVRRGRADINGGKLGSAPVLVPNMLLLGMDEMTYLMKALVSVRAAVLEQTLLLIPFPAALCLLEKLLPLVPVAPQTELVTKCVLFLLKVHQQQVVTNGSLLRLLNALDRALAIRLSAEHAIVGFNLAAMRHVLDQAGCIL